MRHRASPRFWKAYRDLPDDVRALADRCFTLLKADPRHPSLQFKTVGRFRSARVGLHHRALAVEGGPDLIWFWVGSHAEYDGLIARS